jgi:hypothetical protein
LGRYQGFFLFFYEKEPEVLSHSFSNGKLCAFEKESEQTLKDLIVFYEVNRKEGNNLRYHKRSKSVNNVDLTKTIAIEFSQLDVKPNEN